jgi:nucleolar protein 56
VDKVQASVSDMQRFGKVAKLTAFKPFASAADALEQINAVSEANLTDELKNFISMNLPKVWVDAVLGVCGMVGLMRGHTIQQQQQQQGMATQPSRR